MKWLYTQSLRTGDPGLFKHTPREEKEKLQQKFDEDMHLVCLWILADKFLIPQLQKLTMRLLRQRRVFVDEARNTEEPTYRLSSHWMPHVFENTGSGSALRQFAIEQVLVYVEPETFEKHLEHFPQALLLKLASFWTMRIWPYKASSKVKAYTEMYTKR